MHCTRRLWFAAALVSTLWLGSCLSEPTDTRPSPNAKLLLRADLSGTAVATLVVEVTAPDIAPALVFNFGIVAGAAAGTITIPAGADRTITIRAYDAGGVETHGGSVTVNVQPGPNPSIAIVLTPLSGDAPIQVTLGSFRVTVTPDDISLLVDETITLTATILDANGLPVSGQVVWGAIAPGVASVVSTGTQTGRVTAISPGQTTVVATFGGTAAPADVEVPGIFVGAGDIGDCFTTTDEATAQLLDGIPGTVFAAGDNAYPDGRLIEDYMGCYEPTWGRHKARTRPVPGNHEYQTPDAAGYFAYFGASVSGPDGLGYYSFDLGEWHIIALNSEIGKSVGSPQEVWLRADLAANTKQCTLAYWHKPLFSSGFHGNIVHSKPLWRALQDFNAEVVVVGHDHNYERFAPQDSLGIADPDRGLREFVVGTGGTDLRPMNPPITNSEVQNSDTHGVLKLTLHSTGYEWEFIPVAGKTFTDSGSGTCH